MYLWENRRERVELNVLISETCCCSVHQMLPLPFAQVWNLEHEKMSHIIKLFPSTELSAAACNKTPCGSREKCKLIPWLMFPGCLTKVIFVVVWENGSSFHLHLSKDTPQDICQQTRTRPSQKASHCSGCWCCCCNRIGKIARTKRRKDQLNLQTFLAHSL